MTEDQRKILSWRRERRNYCSFPTQASYDEQRSRLSYIKEQLFAGTISPVQARILLVVRELYGEQAASKVVDKWVKERDSQ